MSSMRELFLTLLDIIMVVAVPIILFFIILAGFLYVTAGGNPAQLEKATKALLYAILGGVIIIGARVLFTVVENTINLFG